MTTPSNVGFRFRGRAGQLQAEKRSAALMDELGRNYDTYHAELATAGRGTKRPEPEDFGGDFVAYCAANNTRHDIAAAEVLLRFAYLLKTEGKEAARRVHEAGPLVDSDGNLLSVGRARSASVEVDPEVKRRASELRRRAGGPAPPSSQP